VGLYIVFQKQGDQMSLWKKIPRNCFVKINTKLLPWGKVARKFWALFSKIFKKTSQRKQPPNGRKFAQSGHPDSELTQFRWWG
jgi:hypothetical protein